MKASAVVPQETQTALVRDEQGAILPIIENFYRFCAERKLMGLKCRRCLTGILPPRTFCPNCSGTAFDWIEFKGRGRLLTYTIIHFPPTPFQALAPYAVGIVKLEDGPQLSGMIKNVKLEELRIGMEVDVDFETALPKEWPRWPRYFFKTSS